MPVLDDIFAKYSGKFSDKLSKKPLFREETTWVADKSILVELLSSLKEDGFDYLVDIAGVDLFGSEPRFEVAYELCDLSKEIHLRVKTSVSEDDLTLPSITKLWATANWQERELFDMMGIKIVGHPDLRRIIMWDGYPFHPLRKDFPLEGKPTEMPDIAFTKPAPLEGGPFVTSPSSCNSQEREPRAKPAEMD